MSDLVSRSYKLDPAMACERCVFGTGDHTGGFLVEVRDEFLAEYNLKPRPHWHRVERFLRWLVPIEEFDVIFRTILQRDRPEPAKLPIESKYYYRGKLVQR